MSIDRFWILVARKLSGESSVEEIRELEALLRIHPHLHFSIEIISNLWNQQVKKDELQLETSYALHIERMQNMGVPMHSETATDAADTTYLLHGSRTNRLAKRLAIAGSILVLIFAGGFYYYRGGITPAVPAEKVAQLAVSTKYGSRTNIQLPDGSKVSLNSGSTLTYDKQFGQDIREVVLSGEAYFDVVRNPEKPFVIHTSTMDIKVLGTQFNVKSYSTDKVSEASLIHGSIEVSLKKRGAAKILLKPNEKIVVMNDRFVRTDKPVIAQNKSSEQIFSVEKLNYDSKDSTIVETSWIDHKLIFANESFEDIAVKMERWFGMPVTFDHIPLKYERLTGSFKDESIYEALVLLQETTPFHYIKRNNSIIITK